MFRPAALPRLVLLLAAVIALAACAPEGPPPGGSVAALEQLDQVVGDGIPARSGDRVSVHYTGWIYDERNPDRRGARFDSSLDRGQPFSFVLGAGQVIRGWDEGVAGMKVGGKRTLVIPPDLAYGRRGAGRVIRPHSSLVFEIELLDVAR
jgi:FKBP-type peptidyl-prolyl cis-trans isomerase FkpA